MHSLYRRRVRITILGDNEEDQSHGWATTVDERGHSHKHFFKAQQPRFISRTDERCADTICQHFEGKGIFPDSITVKHNGFTFSFTGLAQSRAHKRARAA